MFNLRVLLDALYGLNADVERLQPWKGLFTLNVASEFSYLLICKSPLSDFMMENKLQDTSTPVDTSVRMCILKGIEKEKKA